MNFTNGLVSVSCRSFDDRTDLLEETGHSNVARILESENARVFHLIRCKPSVGRDGLTASIGIGVEDHGLDPEILLLSDSDLVLVGFNRDVVALAPRLNNIAFEIKLPTLFGLSLKCPHATGSWLSTRRAFSR